MSNSFTFRLLQGAALQSTGLSFAKSSMHDEVKGLNFTGLIEGVQRRTSAHSACAMDNSSKEQKHVIKVCSVRKCDDVSSAQEFRC
jgi:hypothetical protein